MTAMSSLTLLTWGRATTCRAPTSCTSICPTTTAERTTAYRRGTGAPPPLPVRCGTAGRIPLEQSPRRTLCPPQSAQKSPQRRPHCMRQKAPHLRQHRRPARNTVDPRTCRYALLWGPRIIATDRQAPRIYPQMIRLCSRFDSVLFTPKMSEIPSYGNYSRSP